MLGSVGRVDQGRLRTGKLTDDEWPRVTDAIAKLSQAPILIDETGALNSLELRARARRMARKWGQVGLIIIDYLQLMTGNSSGSGENRTSEISEISRSLKALAKEMQCPVIALSQLNRGLEQRPNKRPVMSDLRECVVGDTLVYLADGQRVPIRQLVGQTPVVLAMDETQKIISAQSDMVWSVGVKAIVKLTTASGRVLKATDGHRIFTGDGWKTIGQSKVGDRLAIARKIPAQTTKKWEESHLVLLAHLIGDGSYVNHQPMRYTTASEENSLAVRLAAESLGSTVRRVDGPTGTWHQLIIAGNGNRWHPKAVGAWLKDLGIYGQRSKEKHVPSEVFELHDDQIALFLKHLWATDGCIYFKKNDQRASSRIYFASCSEKLVRDVQALLLRLGISSRLRSILQKNHNPLWNIDISGATEQLKFLDLVGAFGEKIARADALKEHLLQIQANTNVDTLPIELIQEIKSTMRDLRISQREMAQMRGTSYGGSSHFSFAPSREVLSDYARLLNSANLSLWAESDLFWDRIVSIEPDGEEEVFDLTVPGPASWLADGLVSHNSGAIEQDADVILFIYRDEVYHADTTTEKGIAEVIVGKQRNGPIGTIKLSWQGQFTKFDNLALGAIPPPFAGGGYGGGSSGGYGGGDGGNFTPF
jgi:replicative DNA helicase